MRILQSSPIAGASSRRKIIAHAAASERPKVSMVSLGCPKNTVDGEVLLGDLYRNGFTVTDQHDE